MCGIVAMFGSVDRTQLVRMTRRLAHRGPDGMGVEVCGLGGLGHTRLSLLDLAGGAQPLWSRRGRRVLTYNGELYNHDELRRELVGLGVAFSSRCDTEVVLAAFEQWGEDCVERFDGMYAFAVLEPERLVVARDPFGIKPLFCTTSADRRRVSFASEVAALLAGDDVSAALDRTSLLETAVLGYPLEQRTLFAAIERVAPGTVIEVRAGLDGALHTSVVRRARAVPCAPREVPCEAPASAVARCEEHLTEQVRLQLIADHPVGVLLSGGLDSSIIAALAARHCPRLYTFTLGTRADDEFAVAAEVARALGSEHDARLVGLDECLRLLPRTIAQLAWPTSFSLVESATARMRRSVKAVLCGDGADELFGGYLVHASPRAWLDFVRGRLARATAAEWGADPTPLADALGALAASPGPALRDLAYRWFLDNQLGVAHLERWDHLSMADGLEIRVPFLCRALGQLASELGWPELVDATGGKQILRQVARRVLPESVREQVVGRRKRPFWEATAGLYAELQALVRSIMPEDVRATHPFRQVFDSRESQLFFDLFALIFLGHRGVVPEGFEVKELYDDRWGLRDILARAAA